MSSYVHLINPRLTYYEYHHKRRALARFSREDAAVKQELQMLLQASSHAAAALAQLAGDDEFLAQISQLLRLAAQRDGEPRLDGREVEEKGGEYADEDAWVRTRSIHFRGSAATDMLHFLPSSTPTHTSKGFSRRGCTLLPRV